MILYIDDDEEDVEIFLDAARSLPFPPICLTASDGEHALQLLDELTILPDLIFLDVNMPRMDGKDCLSRIRNKSHLKDIPVIIYSTTNNRKEIEQFRQMGACFLLKHSNFKKLCIELKAIISSVQ